jgi:hypothetical protein
MKETPSRKVLNSLKWYFVVGLVGFAWAAVASTSYAGRCDVDQCIYIDDIGDTDTTADGTVFTAEANPTFPSTGTGVFQPFTRHQATSDGYQSGYNTDAGEPIINNDEKNGSAWTRSVLIDELDTSGDFITLQLDANEPDGKKRKIEITNMMIYIGTGDGLDNPEGNCSDTDATDGTLCSVDADWELDNATNGDVTVILDASICSAAGQCGSGHGDLEVQIATSLLGDLSAGQYFVLFVEYDKAADGFEEWRFGAGVDVPPSVPEPSATLLLGLGLLGVGMLGRKRRVQSKN